MYKTYIKPILDIILAFVGILLTMPLLLITALILMLENKGTPFFLQERPGQFGRIFKIIKFKTMNDNKNSKGELLSDGERITNIGKLIRKISLDELLQLFNVLKGDMSLIGPRPLLPEYLALYSEEQSKRHLVKPGITGWAQINGRNTISWTKKFEYDIWYVQNLSFLLDMKILVKTIIKVFNSEGINAENSVTTEKFTGHN